MSESITELWDVLKVHVESLEQDLQRSVKGNASAGIRLRKGLRLMRQSATDLIKASLAAKQTK